MELFIIGNGFDMAHNLPTTYWDFRTYLENMYPNFLYSFEEEYWIYPRSDEDTKKAILWNDFETNLANINEEIIIEQVTNIELGLESGDVGIGDTLYHHISDKYEYIKLLNKYINQWVRTIKIRDNPRKTSKIKDDNDVIYITFNYTAVLENNYGINKNKVMHIHGSLRKTDGDPVIGHGNKARIENIKKKRNNAENLFNEKETSACRIIEDYYNYTYKDINRYIPKLNLLLGENINEISVIGHSLSGVDLPYFNKIDNLTGEVAIWNVYYRRKIDKDRMINSLIEVGIENKRIKAKKSKSFFDL